MWRGVPDGFPLRFYCAVVAGYRVLAVSRLVRHALDAAVCSVPARFSVIV